MNKYRIYKPTGQYDVVSAHYMLSDDEGVSFYLESNGTEKLIALYKDWTHFFIEGHVEEGNE